MKLLVLTLVCLLQAPTDPGPRTWLPITAEDALPRLTYPVSMSGHTDLDRLERVMAHVRAGIMPDDAEQTPTPQAIAPGQPIVIEWQHVPDPSRPVQFRYYLDGAVIRNFTAADLTVTGTNPRTYTTNAGVIVPFSATARGSHTLAITAYDADGESSRTEGSVPIVVGFTTAPSAPVVGSVKIKIGGV